MAGTRRKTNSAIKTSASKRAKTIDLGWKGDDEIDSEDDSGDNRADESSDSEEEETLEAKKVRLAREYLTKIDQEGSSSEDSDDDDEPDYHDNSDRVGLKLQRQRLKREGNYERAIADKLAKRLEAIKLDLADKRRQQPKAKKSVSLKAREQSREWVDNQHVTLLKGHDLTTTCVSLQRDGSRAVSGSKDHSVILWDMEQSKRIVNLWDHWRKRKDDDIRTEGQVLSVACSDDGRYAAVGRRDASVQIFDIRQSQKGNLVKTFTGHKSGITCLAFQTQSLQLFSGSEDRCIRHYNLEEMMYLETLYGHQFGVTGMDCHRKERPISVSRDRTARAWKLQEDTHLIFRGGAKLSAGDCVSLIKDDWFLSGHENGQLCLWMTDKKKAITTIDCAHGIRGSSEDIGNSVGSICALKGSDLACSGSSDGFLRFWKVRTGATLAERGLEPLSQVPLHGFINGIDMGPKAKFCVAAIGQEPRLGRWNRVAKAKNRVAIVKLNPEDTEGASDDDEDEDAAGEDYNEPAGVQSYDAGEDDSDSDE